MRNVPFKKRLLRSLDRVAPTLSGLWGARKFMETRTSLAARQAGVPLGAKRMTPPAGVTEIKEVYVWGGAAPLVFLIHGWGSDSSAMFGLARVLRARGYCVVAFDVPGHGVNPGTHTTMTAFVRTVAQMLEQFRPDQPIAGVVAHSLGGLAAVAALHQSGRCSDKLVLIAAPTTLEFSLQRFLSSWRLGRGAEAKIRSELLRSHGVPIEHWDMRTLPLRHQPEVFVVHDADDSMVPCSQADEVLAALGGDGRFCQTHGLGHGRVLIDPETLSVVAAFIAEQKPLAINLHH